MASAQPEQREIIITGHTGGDIHTERQGKFMLAVNTGTIIQRHQVGEILMGLMMSQTPLRGKVIPLPESSQWARDEGFTGIIFPNPEYNFP